MLPWRPGVNHYRLQETEIQGSALQRQLSYGQTATDGAAQTVSVPSLSKEVVNFLPDGGVLKLILLSSTDFSFVASRSLWKTKLFMAYRTADNGHSALKTSNIQWFNCVRRRNFSQHHLCCSMQWPGVNCDQKKTKQKKTLDWLFFFSLIAWKTVSSCNLESSTCKEKKKVNHFNKKKKKKGDDG